MPVHDWTRVDAGLFHAFHQQWISSLSDALNTSSLPPDCYALIERSGRARRGNARLGEAKLYADRADRVAVRYRHGDVVAVVEIVSPGNKGSKAEFKAFIDKSAALIRHKIHLVVIDLFPPTKRDPQGIHKATWDEFEEEEFTLPANQPLVVASYDAGPPQVAYVETLGVGNPLPEMPLFLRPEIYVPAPLEATYQTTWSVFPKALKGILEG